MIFLTITISLRCLFLKGELTINVYQNQNQLPDHSANRLVLTIGLRDWSGNRIVTVFVRWGVSRCQTRK